MTQIPCLEYASKTVIVSTPTLYENSRYLQRNSRNLLVLSVLELFIELHLFIAFNRPGSARAESCITNATTIIALDRRHKATMLFYNKLMLMHMKRFRVA